jgi:hypothetical protein
MGPKAPKKTKEEIAAEKAAADAEAFRLAEIERKKAEALAEKKRLEAIKLQEEREASRKLEIERLGMEYSAFSNQLKKRQAQKSAYDEVEFVRQEWEKFRAPTDAPDAENENDMNTFITLTSNMDVSEMADVLKVVTGVKLVSDTVESVWSKSLAERNYHKLGITNAYLEQFSKAIVDKFDAATSNYLRFVDNHLNDRSEIQVEEVAEGAVLGLWGSFNEMRPIRKSIQFERMGIQFDIPKQVLQQSTMVHRAIRIPIDHLSTSIYNKPDITGMSKQVLGDLFQVDILVPPPQAFEIRAKRWIIRDKSARATALRRIPYPSNVGMRCFIKVPENVIMGADVRVMIWKADTLEWTEDGIQDYQYSETGRLCQFMMTTVGTFALVKDRTVDFPYKKWTLCPQRTVVSGDKSAEQETRLTLHSARFEIVIEVKGSQCYLAKAFDPAVSDLVGQALSPGSLLAKLQKRGVNLLPHASDVPRVEHNGSAKTLALEDDVLSEIARVASAIDFSSSPWNKEIGSQQVGLLARESTVYTARGESYDFECVLAEEDIVTESRCYAPSLGSILGVGASNCVFRCVLGNQYGTRPGYSHISRPGQVSHVELIEALKLRTTPEAFERANRTNELFQDTVFKLLQMIRPLSLTFDEGVR